MTSVAVVVQHTAAENPLRSVHESVSSPVLRVRSIAILKVKPNLCLRLGKAR